MMGACYILYGQYHIKWKDYEEAKQSLLNAKLKLSSYNPTSKVVTELYYSFIELCKEMNDDIGTKKYYERAIEGIKSNTTICDDDWQILLGYAQWLYSIDEYEHSLEIIWECISNIKDVLYQNTNLKYDPIGPWKYIFILLTEINKKNPSNSSLNMKRFHQELNSVEVYFKKAKKEILNTDLSKEIELTSFPCLMSLHYDLVKP